MQHEQSSWIRAEARQSAILDALPAHIALLDAHGVIVSVNEAWRRFATVNLLRSPGGGVGLNYLEICDIATGDASSEGGQVAEGIRSVLAGSAKSFSIDYPCHSPTEQHWFLLTVTPLADDRSNGAVVTHMEVTGERLLRASELRFRQMAENIRDVFFLKDADSDLMLYVSPAYEEIVGRTCESAYATAHAWTEGIHPDDRDAVREKYNQQRASGFFEYEHRIVRPDGSIRWIETRGFPVRDESGRIVRIAGVGEDITERKLVAQELRESERRLFVEKERAQVTLACIGDAVACTDISGNITFLNLVAETMTGWTSQEATGRPMAEVLRIIDSASGDPVPLSRETLAQNPIVASNDVLIRRDGVEMPIEDTVGTIHDREGEATGAVVVFRDVTERRAMERLKGEFVSTVSHELRTPLTSIRGALGLLSSGMLGAVEERGRRMLEIAVSNTDRLVRLINDILDLERIESGKVELERGPVDANAVMVQALEGVQSMADQARVRLAILPAAGTLWGDSDRIIQTLTNLLGNAIKFSPPDTTVTLSGAAREADFLFSVADQGRGVPEQKLETIFERFSQVDGSDSRDRGGSGLGLAICRSIIEAHDGRIWAEKNDPAGSRFQFTIPLDRDEVAVIPVQRWA